jgi:glycosyltransferase involved in cell wall biosynthesis
MKIAVNTRLLLKGKMDGIGWFTYETLKRIVKLHPEHEFIFIFDRKYDPEFIFAKNVTPIVITPPARHPVLWYIYFEYSIPYILNKIKPDVFLSPDGWLSLRTKYKQIAVIHDINFEHYPEFLPFTVRKYYLHFFRKFANKAERIATVSEFTKKDIVEKYKIASEKIDVVYNGANEKYCPLPVDKQEPVRQKYTGGAEYFLFIGTIHQRKNLINLILAFDKFKETNRNNVKLLIVGAIMWDGKKLDEVLKKIKHRSDIIFAGRADEDELATIIASALAMVYPSYFEGFGIPIVEAMYCDVPVITSNVTSMPEVAGDAALLVEPHNVDSISEALGKIYSDKDLRNTLIRQGRQQRELFSWQKSAERLWDTIIKSLSS